MCSSIILFWLKTEEFVVFSCCLGVSPYPFLCVCALTVDHSGTMDDREPLTHAIKSDSAVIGGNWDARVIFLVEFYYYY